MSRYYANSLINKKVLDPTASNIKQARINVQPLSSVDAKDSISDMEFLSFEVFVAHFVICLLLLGLIPYILDWISVKLRGKKTSQEAKNRVQRKNRVKNHILVPQKITTNEIKCHKKSDDSNKESASLLNDSNSQASIPGITRALQNLKMKEKKLKYNTTDWFGPLSEDYEKNQNELALKTREVELMCLKNSVDPNQELASIFRRMEEEQLKFRSEEQSLIQGIWGDEKSDDSDMEHASPQSNARTTTPAQHLESLVARERALELFPKLILPTEAKVVPATSVEKNKSDVADVVADPVIPEPNIIPEETRQSNEFFPPGANICVKTLTVIMGACLIPIVINGVICLVVYEAIFGEIQKSSDKKKA